MNIRVTSLTSRNVEQCSPFWGGLTSYHPRERQQVFEAAARLLDERRAFGALILQDERPRAFGMSAFAREEFVENFLKAPTPQIGKQLLLDASHGGDLILTRKEIGIRNAGGGGQAVILNCGWDPTGPDAALVFGRVVSASHDTHRAHRVARLLNESFGKADVALLVNSGGFEVRCTFREIAPGVPIPSVIATLTREEAFERHQPMLPTFSYVPPRIFFTEPEQELLSAALGGGTDESLSAQLGVPLTAVKSRWTRIQRRAAAALPQLFGMRSNDPFRQHRGAQVRHVLLQYLRENPSELTPYCTASAAAETVTPRSRRRPSFSP